MLTREEVLDVANSDKKTDLRSALYRERELDVEVFEEVVYAYINWLEDDEGPVDRTVTYKLDSDRPLESFAFLEFSNWVTMLVYDDWWLLVEGIGNGVVRDEWTELYHRDEEFRDRLHKQTVAVNERNKRVGRFTEYVDKNDGKDEDGEDIMEYGKLNEAGIVDEDNNIDRSKLRGTVLKFAKEVESIKGTEEDLNRDDLRAAYNRWMLDRIGTDWSKFISEKMEPGDLMDVVLYMYKYNDDFKQLVQEKYEYDPEQLEGNGDKKREWKKRNKRQDVTNYDSEGERKNGEEDEEDESEDGNTERNGGSDSGDSPIPVTGSDVIHGDCIDVIRRVDGRNFDALITDPPYGQNYDSRGDEHEVIEADDNLEDALSVTENIAKKARMNMSKGSPVIMFAGDSNLCGVKRIVSKWFDYKQTIIWDKDWIGSSAIGGNPIRFRKKHEYIVIGCYGKPKHENENRHDGTILKFRRPSGDNRIHPTEKPLDLMRYIIDSFTQEGDLVFDPFSGSGATLVAAKQENRGYFGVEFDEEFYNGIKDRLSQDTFSKNEKDDAKGLGKWT